MDKLLVKKQEGKIYSFIRDKWLVCTPEEEVRQGFVCTLVNDYGYSLNQLGEELQVNNSSRGTGRARADIVVWKSEKDKIESNSAFIVVECKAENIKIYEEDYYQGSNYALYAGANFFVTTNNRETKYFHVIQGKIPKKLNEIVSIPKASEVESEKKILEILNQTKKFSREEFTDLLLKCHNIIRNNDKLSPEAAFDEISKILFIKINYEREQKGKEVFKLEEYERQEIHHEKVIRPNLKGTNKDLSYMQFMFLNTKEQFKHDSLFEENEIIKIRETSFKAILKLLEKYNLSDTSDDVKGIAFEQFLGRTFRGELGQFFTPRTIVDFMIEVLDPQEGELICDPCCGSGGFLIKAFDYIKENIEKSIQETKEKTKRQLVEQYPEDLSEAQQIELNSNIDKAFKQLNKELEHIHSNDFDGYSRLDVLSYKSIYGTDANPRMARTSKMNMIMHGDGHGGVHRHDGLININGIFEGRFDVILTNPPFGASVAKDQYIERDDIEQNNEKISYYKELYGEEYVRQINELKRIAEIIPGDDKKLKKEKSLLNFYKTGKMSALTEVLFIERCLRLLKPGGRMGIVLPEGVLNNSNLQKVREYFEGQAKIILICSIPQDVFIKAGASVKASLVFLKKFTDDEREQYDSFVARAQKEIEADYADEIQQVENAYIMKEIKTKALRRKQIKAIELKKQADVKALVKKLFDYRIPIAKVEKAGITATGNKCDNELNDVLVDFKTYFKKNPLWNNGTDRGNLKIEADLNNIKINKLSTINYSNLYNWCILPYVTHTSYQTDFALIRIGSFLKRIKNNVKINDEIIYKRATIKINNGGIHLRDSIIGKDIGTKNQFLIKEGQLLLSKIDARNGAFGIVPKELDGGVITGNFWVFDIDTSVILPQVLCNILASQKFQDIWATCSNGTTNRHYLQESSFLNTLIPVPTIPEQINLLSAWTKLVDQKIKIEQEIETEKQNFESAIFG